MDKNSWKPSTKALFVSLCRLIVQWSKWVDGCIKNQVKENQHEHEFCAQVEASSAKSCSCINYHYEILTCLRKKQMQSLLKHSLQPGFCCCSQSHSDCSVAWWNFNCEETVCLYSFLQYFLPFRATCNVSPADGSNGSAQSVVVQLKCQSTYFWTVTRPCRKQWRESNGCVQLDFLTGRIKIIWLGLGKKSIWLGLGNDWGRVKVQVGVRGEWLLVSHWQKKQSTCMKVRTLLFILLHLTSSFPPIIIAMATRGRQCESYLISLIVDLHNHNQVFKKKRHVHFAPFYKLCRCIIIKCNQYHL